MKNLNQATLEAIATASIEDTIYHAAQVMGGMMQSVWLFTIPEDPESGPIMGISVQNPADGALLPAMIAFTRQQVLQSKPDFSVIVAEARPAESVEEAQERVNEVNVGDFSKVDEAKAYAFYVEAPGLDPIILIQRYHRDKDGFVVLDGGLHNVPIDKTRANNYLNNIAPWAEMTEEDRRIVNSTDVQPMQIDPRVFASKDLKMSTLFPKDLTN